MNSISPKVAASSIGAAIATIVCAILVGFGYQPDVILQGAITIVIVFVLGYLRMDPARNVRK
jgi:multisubunit Na+/H+ antiporter MnhB subunit